MSAADFQIDESGGDSAVLRLSGDWTTGGLGQAARRLSDQLSGRTVSRIDIADLGRFDTAGALIIVQATNKSLPAEAWSSRPEAGRIYTMVEKLERESALPPKRPDALTRTFAKIGHGVYDIGGEMILSMAFLGRLITASGAAPCAYSSRKWCSTVQNEWKPTLSPRTACSMVFWYASNSLCGFHGRGTGIS